MCHHFVELYELYTMTPFTDAVMIIRTKLNLLNIVNVLFYAAWGHRLTDCA